MDKATCDEKGGWHPFWDLDSLGTITFSGTRTYPVRHLRYWFMSHLLRLEELRLQHPLSVLEVGVGNGHLLFYIKFIGNRRAFLVRKGYGPGMQQVVGLIQY